MKHCKIAWAAKIYRIWLLRNTSIHSGKPAMSKIEDIFEPLEMIFGGGLVFVKKKKKLQLV